MASVAVSHVAGDETSRSNGALLAKSPRPSKSESPLKTLGLRKEVLLNGPLRRCGFAIVEMLIRILPAFVIYGGTMALCVCVFFKYRWGVFMSLMLYAMYMCFHMAEFVVFALRGIVLVWVNTRNDWHAMYLKWVDKELAISGSPTPRYGVSPSGGSHRSLKQRQEEAFSPGAKSLWDEEGTIGWHDIIHVVMVPTYKTPMEVLDMSLRQCAEYSLARTNLAICMAFEEREPGCREKAQLIKDEWGETFKFVTAAFHPPNLPNHVPGKSSNECWAFSELRKELEEVHNFDPADPRVLITVIDDDSELHVNYFEALNYHFIKASDEARYLTIWQPPVCHFKNFIHQPLFVRTASIFASLHELACLANPVDCHVPFSSYSISFILASSVGGWDPDFISEDWHMMAKCTLKTEGRARCKPIFLPLVNYAPEEETVLGTIHARWIQATRHALGVSEIVYVALHMYLGALEVPTLIRSVRFLWRMLPLFSKFIAVHFQVGTLAIWPMLSAVLINVYMWRSYCSVDEIEDLCSSCCVPMASATEFGIDQERVILNSWMVYFQQKATLGFAICSILAGGIGGIYVHMVKDRITQDPAKPLHNPFVLWVQMQLEVIFVGYIVCFAFGSLPTCIAVVRIIMTLQFDHVVAGMVGRVDDGTGL